MSIEAPERPTTARVRGVTNTTARVHTRLCETFGHSAFTAPQAAHALGLGLKPTWQYVGTLATAGLLSSRRVVVAYDGKRRIRQRVYRVVTKQ